MSLERKSPKMLRWDRAQSPAVFVTGPLPREADCPALLQAQGSLVQGSLG